MLRVDRRVAVTQHSHKAEALAHSKGDLKLEVRELAGTMTFLAVFELRCAVVLCSARVLFAMRAPLSCHVPPPSGCDCGGDRGHCGGVDAVV